MYRLFNGGLSLIKKREKYQGISLAKSQIDEVKEHIKKYPEYKNVTEFIRYSIYDRLKRERKFDQQVSTAGGVLEWLKHDPETTKDIFQEGERKFNEIIPDVNFWDVFTSDGKLRILESDNKLSMDRRLKNIEQHQKEIIKLLKEKKE